MQKGCIQQNTVDAGICSLWQTRRKTTPTSMKKINKYVDVTRLEKQRSECLSGLTDGLEANTARKRQNKFLWTQEFAATGKDGKR